MPRIWKGRFRGQKQRWFLLRFLGEDAQVDIAAGHPEFSRWAWMAPEELIERIVPFKRATYAAVFDAFRDRLRPAGGGRSGGGGRGGPAGFNLET